MFHSWSNKHLKPKPNIKFHFYLVLRDGLAHNTYKNKREKRIILKGKNMFWMSWIKKAKIKIWLCTVFIALKLT
jgi:hypothetical protein